MHGRSVTFRGSRIQRSASPRGRFPAMASAGTERSAAPLEGTKIPPVLRMELPTPTRQESLEEKPGPVWPRAKLRLGQRSPAGLKSADHWVGKLQAEPPERMQAQTNIQPYRPELRQALAARERASPGRTRSPCASEFPGRALRRERIRRLLECSSPIPAAGVHPHSWSNHLYS